MKMRNILYADDGMVLTNGKTYAKVVYLADGADASEYREISEAEYENIEQEVNEV